jgi:FkbM family methyltransferase
MYFSHTFRQNFSFIRKGTHRVNYIEVDLGGDRMFLPRYATNRGAVKKILNAEIHEPETHAIIKYCLELNPGDLIHAGAFFGDMLPSFSRSCPGTVYAFEPVLENFVLCKLCLERNGVENVVMLNVALSSTTGSGRIQTLDNKRKHWGGGSRMSQSGQLTSVLKIDDLNASKISVIHLDVERHELEALKGATKVLTDQNPILLLEDNSGDCRSFLQSFGYVELGRTKHINLWSKEGDIGHLKQTLERLDFQLA